MRPAAACPASEGRFDALNSPSRQQASRRRPVYKGGAGSPRLRGVPARPSLARGGAHSSLARCAAASTTVAAAQCRQRAAPRCSAQCEMRAHDAWYVWLVLHESGRTPRAHAKRDRTSRTLSTSPSSTPQRRGCRGGRRSTRSRCRTCPG